MYTTRDDSINDNPCDDDAFNDNGCDAFDDNDGRGSNEAASDFDGSCDDV